MLNVYIVERAIWGTDRKENIYFSDRKQADEYAQDNAYCSNPYIGKIPDEYSFLVP